MDCVPCHILHPARVHQAAQIHQCPHQYLPVGHVVVVVVVVSDGEDLEIAAAAEVQAVVVLVVLGAILVGGAVTPEELEDFRTDKGHYRTPEAPQVGANRTLEVVLLGFPAHILVEQGDFDSEFVLPRDGAVVLGEFVEDMVGQQVSAGFDIFVGVIPVAIYVSSFVAALVGTAVEFDAVDRAYDYFAEHSSDTAVVVD